MRLPMTCDRDERTEIRSKKVAGRKIFRDGLLVQGRRHRPRIRQALATGSELLSLRMAACSSSSSDAAVVALAHRGPPEGPVD
jgi:hypothetical protein